MSRVAHHSTPKVTPRGHQEVTPEVTPRVIRQLSRGHQGEIPLNVEFGIIS